MAGTARLVRPRNECRRTSVRDEYIAAVNNAVAAGRDDLAAELATDYEQEYVRPALTRTPSASDDVINPVAGDELVANGHVHP